MLIAISKKNKKNTLVKQRVRFGTLMHDAAKCPCKQAFMTIAASFLAFHATCFPKEKP